MDKTGTDFYKLAARCPNFKITAPFLLLIFEFLSTTAELKKIKSTFLKWKYVHSGNVYRLATVSKSKTTTGITMQVWNR